MKPICLNVYVNNHKLGTATGNIPSSRRLLKRTIDGVQRWHFHLCTEDEVLSMVDAIYEYYGVVPVQRVVKDFRQNAFYGCLTVL